MNYDIDYEIYQYINQQAENYIPLEKLLSQQNLTYDTVLQKMAEFKENCHFLLEKYHIRNQNLASIYYDLAEKINQFPENQELQYLYFCILTDTGLLNPISADEQTEEQTIRNYIRQKEKIQELTDFMKIQIECKEKLKRLKANLKKSESIENSDSIQEFQLLYELTIQHTFLYGANKNQIYRENLQSLLTYLNSNENLKSIKPYLIFAVLSRKHGMMQNREHFMPNLKTAFQYQEYQIYTDNRKNFNLYQSYLELYDHLRRFYMQNPETDVTFCDFCFANFSPLNEWYYAYCQPDIEVPMNLKLKVQQLKALSFPMLYRYEDYSEYDISEFEAEHSEIWQIWEKSIDSDLTEKFMQAIYHNADKSEVLKKLPYYGKYPEYAELCFYESAENLLNEKMLNIAEKI